MGQVSPPNLLYSSHLYIKFYEEQQALFMLLAASPDEHVPCHCESDRYYLVSNHLHIRKRFRWSSQTIPGAISVVG